MEAIQSTDKQQQMSAIERALAAAKARKAAKGDDAPAAEPKPKAVKEPRVKADPAARAAAREAKAAEMAAARAARKADREAKRAAKLAERAAAASNRKPAHMKKVERARAKCPPLSGAATAAFNDVTTNLSAAQIDALAQHLLVHNRATATMMAAGVKPFPLGTRVRITGGDARYIGSEGEVVHSQRLHMKIAVAGVKRPVYIYNGQADKLTEETTAVAV